MASLRLPTALRRLALARPTSAATAPFARRLLHSRVPLPYELEAGLAPFLSPQALNTIAVEWQQGVLGRLEELVRGTEVESLSVLQTVKQTASNPAQALAFNYASEALNNSFFLSTLTPTPSPPTPSSSFSQSLARSPLKSFPALISHFSAHVAGLHPSSGAYVWLVTDQQGNLGVLGTYAGGTALVQERRQVGALDSSAVLGELIPRGNTESANAQDPTTNEGAAAVAAKGPWKTNSPTRAEKSSGASSHLLDEGNFSVSSFLHAGSDKVGQTIHPLACLSVHPHCYLNDYGVWGREEYVRRWWNAVDWKKVEHDFAGFVNKS